MSNKSHDEAMMDAAEERAKSYDDDDRECIKADVMNAFYAGAAWRAEWAAKQAKGEEGCGCTQGQCCPECDPDVYASKA